MCCKFAATVLTVPRWVKYCSDLKVLNKCFMLVGAEQHSDLLKVNIHIISIYFHDILLYSDSETLETLRLFINMTDVTLAGTDVSSYGVCCNDGRDRQAKWWKGLDWTGGGT